MQTNPSQQPESHIPWYKSRKVWGVVIGLGILTNTILVTKVTNSIGNLIDVIVYLGNITGSSTFWMLSAFIQTPTENTAIIVACIYLPIFVSLLFFSFRSKQIAIIPAGLLFINILASIIFSYLFFSAFS